MSQSKINYLKLTSNNSYYDLINDSWQSCIILDSSGNLVEDTIKQINFSSGDSTKITLICRKDTIMSGQCILDKAEGQFVYFDHEGNVKSTVNLLNGKRHGIAVEYILGGGRAETYFFDDKKEGAAFMIDGQGRFLSKITYNSGEPKLTLLYNYRESHYIEFVYENSDLKLTNYYDLNSNTLLKCDINP